MPNRSRLVLVFVAVALVLGACGDAQPTPTATAAPTTTMEVSGQRAPLAGIKVPESTTSTTVAPSTTTTTTEPPIVVGSVDTPIALGSPRVIGDWVITVVEVDADAETAVLNENPFNDPAGDDERFVLVDIQASYVGGDTGFPWIEINHWMLGENNLLYKGIDSECGVVPNDLSYVGEVFPGGTVHGSVCHRVATADASQAVLVIEESFTIGDADAAVFALHEGVGSVPLEVPPTLPSLVVGGPSGSIGNPIELSSPGRVGEWLINVEGVDLDATSAILAENQFNDPPDSGFTFVLVSIAATYEGTETGDPWFDIRGKIIGESRVAYEGYEAYCGVIPNDFTAVGDIEPGTTVVGNMCWSVATNDLDSLMLILEDTQNYDGGRLFYALG